MNGIGRLRGDGVRMHAHVAEAVPEAWFEEGARRRIERLSGCHKPDDRDPDSINSPWRAP
jgi:hypothetical protein